MSAFSPAQQSEITALVRRDTDRLETLVRQLQGPAAAFFVGQIATHALASPPTLWLNCNGAATSRTTYAALFAAIGTTYGAGDGSTTFNLPNLLGRVPMGADPTNASTATGHTAHALGASGGEETHTLSAANMPAHTHPPGSGTKFFDWDSPAGNTTFGAGGNTPSTAATTGSTGGGGAHNNLPPFTVVNYVIFSGA